MKSNQITLLPYVEDDEPFIWLLEAMIKLAKKDLKRDGVNAITAKEFLDRMIEWI